VDRRTFVCALTGALLAAPLAAEGQPARRAVRIGFLSSSVSPAGLEPFRQGLRERGYFEDRHVAIEARFASLDLDRLPGLAAELVQLHVDVIVTASTPAAQAAKNATQAIPIVMTTGGDPVGARVVNSLARPGGNVTGLTHLAGPEMQQKLLELLKQVAPLTVRLSVITNQAIPPEASGLNALQGPARALGLTLVPVEVRRQDQFEAAFMTIVRDRTDSLFAFESPLNVAYRKQIVEFAAKHRLPTAFGARAFVDAGGLMSYGTDFSDLYRRGAIYVEKILKGAKPADLPVEQPTKFELIINLKTAKALGLTIPPSLLQRADQVIE
jgi:putative ABC transport system substrate-binding protein